MLNLRQRGATDTLFNKVSKITYNFDGTGITLRFGIKLCKVICMALRSNLASPAYIGLLGGPVGKERLFRKSRYHNWVFSM